MKNKEATQEEGVSKAGPRDEFMAEIARQARAERDGIDPTAEDNSEVEEENTEEVVEPTEEKEEETTAPENDADEKTDYVTLKVEGEERQVERDKVLEAGIRAMQKESAADKRLQEATELLREAKEAQTKTALPDKPDEPEEPEYTPEQLAHALQYGDDDEAQEAIKLILEGRKSKEVATQTIDEDQIRNVVRIETEFNNAIDRFKDEYPEIVSDSKLLKLADIREKELRDNGDNRPFWEVYKEVGDEIREWTGSVKPTDSGLSQRKARKESIQNVEGANAPTGKKKQPAKPKTYEEVLNDMRKARHQN